MIDSLSKIILTIMLIMFVLGLLLHSNFQKDIINHQEKTILILSKTVGNQRHLINSLLVSKTGVKYIREEN